MARAHTAVAALLVAAIVLIPLAFWLYAQAASADRAKQVAHAKRLLTDVAPPLAGARRLGPLNVYERRKWDGESLVPIAGYNVETAYRLPAPLRPASIVAHYRRRLPGWTMAKNSTLGVTFVRGSDRIELDTVEYRGSSPRLRSYGVIVSQ